MAMIDSDSAVRDAASEALEKVNPKIHKHVFTVARGQKKRAAMLELAAMRDEAKIVLPLLLHYHQNPELWWNSEYSFRYDPHEEINLNSVANLLPLIAKINSKDKRFAAIVLTSISTKQELRDIREGRPPGGRLWREFGYDTRAFGLPQLNTIDAPVEDKVAALCAAIEDGHHQIEVIKVLQGFGRNAGPALPALKKLKKSSNDAIRDAAISAIEKIE